ncbi:MAG: HesA/MoeB/ThiF family protein [Deltaproteobacteria bacterium]|nr:HesA/MoeB/ThiF family protein [Deltaproteobacteria bacterium]
MSSENSSGPDLRRYRRQIILPGWGDEAQQKLSRSTVFVAGAGGLGCAVTLNLTLAGVGRLRICDSDTVDITNLNRQFLHMEQSIGSDKTLSAQATLSAINSEITIETVSQKITDSNVDEIVGDAQLIIDCLDNFDGRYALNLCAVRKGIPMVHGAIWGLEGRITFLHPPKTPCLACFFPKAPDLHEIPVLGAVPCTTGSLQAIEALKHLTGSGTTLKGRMLVMDFSTMRFQDLEVRRNPHCPVCASR